ncbi:MAG: His-Xaa-Ser system radical SAM maturase HxsB [Phycisphaerae bacterium]|jgi:His-Xaa-Ser system radical SAM maturase HxsB
MSAQSPLLDADRFRPTDGRGYQLLPFDFTKLDKDRYILTNVAGEHVVAPTDLLHSLIRHRVDHRSPIYEHLKARHFLIDDSASTAIDLLSTQVRTKHAVFADFTGLHIFVPTLRCTHGCSYCQVSQQTEDLCAYDMSGEVADASVDFMFRSPSPYLKVEFQGGEPLLRFDLVKHIVHKVKDHPAYEHRSVDFVICTNLSPLTDDMLEFCQLHDVCISTSLDGPRDLHNQHRHFLRGDSYDSTIQGISRARAALGPDRVSALMTTTRGSLSRGPDIIDEYLRQGFRSVFLRPINPYGRAVERNDAYEYSVDEWLSFYKDTLAYIFDVNNRGVRFREDFSAIILRKMLTPFETGFVDLRSPAGIGIGVLVYNYDGGVYLSDEARMLAEMGDRHFRLGSVVGDTYEALMLNDRLLAMLDSTMTVGVPGCERCAFQAFCGADPVKHYRLQGDYVGYKPTSEFCQRNMGVMKHLVRLLEDDSECGRILRSWA